MVYLIMVIQGVGTLLPWNMFITAHAVSILFTKDGVPEKDIVFL